MYKVNIWAIYFHLIRLISEYHQTDIAVFVDVFQMKCKVQKAK